MFKVGVRYCGGCNPRYERTDFLKYVEDRLQSVDFENAEEGVLYDALLVICGCSSQCASCLELESKRGIVKVRHEDDREEAINSLMELMEG